MTATAPPRRPDRLDQQAVDALHEQALIEEARERTRRRRRRYGVSLVCVVIGAAAIAAVVSGTTGGRSTASSPNAPSAATSASGGGKIALVDGTGVLRTVNPDGSDLRAITSCSDPACAILEPAWSPDGRQLAFVRGTLEPRTGLTGMAVFVEQADGTAMRRLAGCGSCGVWSGGTVSWSPDGSQIVFTRTERRPFAGSLWAVSLATGEERRLTRCGHCQDLQPAWAPDGGSMLFLRIGRSSSHLLTVGSDGSRPAPIAAGAHPRWSPDGRRIAFDTGDDVYVANADGSNRRLLQSGASGSGPGAPAWSPDGRTLSVFVTPRAPLGGFEAEVWTFAVDGSAKRLLYHSACCVELWAPPVWSPDGTQLAFAANSAGGTYVLSADGTDLHQLSPVAARTIAWQGAR
jgi:Tol biopolymer transport system component